MTKSAGVDLAVEYLEELAVGDLREGEEYGSPYECMHRDGNYRRNPLYMTNVTARLAEVIRTGWVEARPPRY